MNSIVSEHGETHLTYGKYVLGFVGSVTLTVAAYWLATHGTAGNNMLAALLGVLAVTQFIVQMLLFLHVGEERGPRWKLTMAGMMLGVVLILVFGSLWVMNDLNNRMDMQQQEQYLKSQDSL